ncbi:MAG: hypothetical protein ACRD3W_18755, partial [Terriglobales bacterium]
TTQWLIDLLQASFTFANASYPKPSAQLLAHFYKFSEEQKLGLIFLASDTLADGSPSCSPQSRQKIVNFLSPGYVRRYEALVVAVNEPLPRLIKEMKVVHSLEKLEKEASAFVQAPQGAVFSFF